MLTCLIALVISFTAMPEEYESLASLAREDAQRTIKMGYMKKEYSMQAGFYSFPGLEFKLPTALTGSEAAEISGYAIKKNKLAFVSKRHMNTEKLINRPRTIFVDHKTQKLYNMKSKIVDDGEVSIFDCEVVNPYTVFTRLKFYSDPQPYIERQITDEISAGVSCSRAGGFSNYSQCTANLNLNWEKPEEDQDPFDLRPVGKSIPNVPGFKSYLGAYINASAGFKVETTGLFKMRTELDFSFSAMGGIGLGLPKKVVDVSTPEMELEVPIRAIKFHFLGFKLSCGVYAFLDASIDDITATLPEELEYLYKVHFYAKKHLVVTSNGLDDVPWVYKFEPREEKSTPKGTLKDFILGIKLNFTPKVKIGLRMKIELGDIADAAVQAGFQYTVPMEFGFDQNKCVFPYLYGSAESVLDIFIEIPGINVLGFEILPNIFIPYNIFKKDLPIPYCLFDSNRAMEGVENLVFDQMIPSVFIHPKKFEITDQYEHNRKRISNQMILNNKGKTETFNLRDTAYNPTTTFKSGRAFVFTNISSDASIWYRVIWQDPWIFPEIKKDYDDDIKLYQDFHGTVKHYRGIWEDMLSFKGTVGVVITTDIYRSFNVEIQKEFDAPSDKQYVSFHTRVPNNTIYGLITHGDDFPYTSGLTGFKTYDDTIKTVDEIQRGEYKGKDPIKFIIRNLILKENNVDLSNNLAKIYVDLIHDGDTNNIVIFSDDYWKFKNVNNDDFNYIFPSLLQSPDDQIRISIETNVRSGSYDASYSRSIQFSLSVLQEHKTRVFKFSQDNSPDWDLTVKVEEYIPTVIMQIDSQARTGVKGIVCKIYRTRTNTIEFNLDENEQYGIIQFGVKIGSQGIIGKLGCTIQLPEDLQPLSSHFMQLSDGTYVFDLKTGQTWYKDEDGYNYVSIPIRSSNFSDVSYTATLIDIFLSPKDGNGMCGNNPTMVLEAGTNMKSGCIDLPPFNREFSILSSLNGIQQEDVDHGAWMFHRFSLENHSYSRAYFSMITNKFEFSDTVSSIFLSEKDIERYLSYSKRDAFEFKCSRCGSIEVEHKDKSRENLTLKAKNAWAFTPKAAEDLFFYAICSDDSKAYCRISIDLDEDEVTHIKLPSSNGIIDLAKNISSGEIVSGITDFLIANRSKLEIVKLFNGVIQKLSTIANEGVLKVIYTKLEGTDFTEISLSLDDVLIPMSGSKLYDDIAGVLDILGVDYKGMNSSTLELGNEGLIKVATNLITSLFGKNTMKGKSRLLDDEESIAQIGYVVDLPLSYIKSIEVVQTSRSSLDNNDRGKSRIIIIAASAVASIVFVAIVVVIAIVIFVKKVRKLTESENEIMTA